MYSEAIIIVEGKKKKNVEVWIIDLIAWHMTSHKEWLHYYEPISRGSMYMDDNHAPEIAGINSTKVKMDDGEIHTIPEVRHAKG